MSWFWGERGPSVRMVYIRFQVLQANIDGEACISTLHHKQQGYGVGRTEIEIGTGNGVKIGS